MKALLLLPLLCCIKFSNCQNLISNYSFEDTIPISLNPNLYGPEGAPPWFTPICGQSPDYLSSLYYYPNSGVPDNFFGNQYARTGIAYVGFGVYMSSWNYAREKISYRLVAPLQINHLYYLEFFVSCADKSNQAIDLIGAYFSVDTPNFCLGFVFFPQVVNPSGSILSDTINWQKVSGTFTAQGGEQFVSIANFFPDSLIQLYQFPNGTISGSYYYLDDVTLIDCTAAGMQESEAIQLYLQNPAGNTLLFTANEKLTKAALYNLLGEKVLENHFNQRGSSYRIDVAILPKGMYVLVVESEKGSKGIRKVLKL